MIITLDGPAGVGKTTLAKRLATHLAIAYLDTGAMYRAVAWKLGKEAIQSTEKEIAKVVESFRFTIKHSGNSTTLHCDGDPLGDEIRTEEVAMLASTFAKLQAVRSFLTRAQRRIGREQSIVVEGRDMGTVVFPDAEYKFFLDATVEERAARRYKQLKDQGLPPDMENLKQQIEARDDQDRNRKIAPLVAAGDAITIDTTNLDVNGVFQELIQRIA